MASELAARAHRDQVRKSGGLPYFTHLEAVAKLVEEHGHGDPVLVAAAYLHDLLEDRPAFGDELRAKMPAEVVETVEALSEVKLDEQGRRLPKSVRFDRYLRGLSQRSPVTERALPISCADKIHNVESLIEAEARGEPLFLKLNTRPGEQLAHLSRLRPLYADVVAPSLLARFDRAHRELAATVERWLFGRAVMLAAEAHLSQYDRAGQPYILHPLRLSLSAETTEERIVALLHDVVEDSPLTLEFLLREGFSERIVRAVDALTKRPEEAYDAFIERVGRDRLASRVKLLDLAHNSDLSRLPNATATDVARVEKYERASRYLREELAKRNLQIRLSESSVARVRGAKRLPVARGEHVTLARRVAPHTIVTDMAPGAQRAGDVLSLRAVAECCNERVQAWVVELNGSSVRPWDGGVLHVTVSRAEDARSKDSNDLLLSAPRSPISIELDGVVEWVDG